MGDNLTVREIPDFVSFLEITSPFHTTKLARVRRHD